MFQPADLFDGADLLEATHDRLVVPTRGVSLPERYWEDLRQWRRAHLRDLLDRFRIQNDLDRDRELRHIARMSWDDCPTDPPSRLCQATLFTELLIEMRRASPYGSRELARVGTQAVHALTHAFLGFSPRARRRVWYESRDVIPGHEWMKTMSGALAQAHAAHTFTTLGTTTYLPTIDEDVQSKIDLIVRFPNGGDGLCLQTKSDGTRVSHFRVQSALLAQTSAEEETLRRRFLDGVVEFNRVMNLAFMPILVHIGVGNDDGVWSFQTRRAVRNSALFLPSSLRPH